MRITRRQAIAGATAAIVAAPGGAYVARRLLRGGRPVDPDPKGVYPAIARRVDCADPANPTVAENCRPGTPGWRLARADGRIEGFFTRTSVQRGQELVLKLRTADPQYHVEVYRTGYYDDVGARLVARTKPRRAPRQPAPHADARTGLVSASNWTASERFDTSQWPSGVYLAKLVSSGGSDDHAIVVVRDDTRASDVLYLLSDTTYQAYNYWGGFSLYAGEDEPRAVRVAFDRPYSNSSHDQADWYLRAEHGLVKWLEAQGYDVTYAGALDVHLHASAGLGARRVWISGGHNEYWSQRMRDAHEAMLDGGTHLAVMAANTAYWRVRMEPDPWSDEPDRVMVCYKDGEVSLTTLGEGPVRDPDGPTGLWRDPNGANQPENALYGVMYLGQNLTHYSSLVVPGRDASDPLWAHAGLGRGADTVIGRELVGWEWDGVVDNGLTPAGLRHLADTPVNGQLMDARGRPGDGDAVSSAAFHTRASGAHVFATGSILFSWGLDADGRRVYDPGKPQGEPDRRIRQLMTNVLARMDARPGSPQRDLTI